MQYFRDMQVFEEKKIYFSFMNGKNHPMNV